MISRTTTPEKTAVGTLLLNAWSAEFALRIKPLITERDYLKSSLSWAFPQAYFAVLFSARAVLVVDGIQIANPEAIEKRLNQWTARGMYGPVCSGQHSPFVDIMQHRIKGNDQPQTYLTGLEAAALHVKLIEQVHAIALVHETYILNRLGADAYQQLLDTLPPYLNTGFVGTRATLLLSNQE